ncbi:MAG TPA: hypothetical protein VEP90_09565 [Methylomirabilota bacterium]|nr:hypothetical protein [Methylomirabilota bacterium]
MNTPTAVHAVRTADNAQRLTPENIAFLKSLGMQVLRDNVQNVSRIQESNSQQQNRCDRSNRTHFTEQFKDIDSDDQPTDEEN